MKSMKDMKSAEEKMKLVIQRLGSQVFHLFRQFHLLVSSLGSFTMKIFSRQWICFLCERLVASTVAATCRSHRTFSSAGVKLITIHDGLRKKFFMPFTPFMVKLRSVVQKSSSSPLLWLSYFSHEDHLFTGIGFRVMASKKWRPCPE